MKGRILSRPVGKFAVAHALFAVCSKLAVEEIKLVRGGGGVTETDRIWERDSVGTTPNPLTWYFRFPEPVPVICDGDAGTWKELSSA